MSNSETLNESKGSTLKLAVCNIESLDLQHKKWCEEARGYVPPAKKYTDKDGLIHDPEIRLPTYNPENRTRSGIYLLEFEEKYRNDSGFRERMKTIARMDRETD